MFVLSIAACVPTPDPGAGRPSLVREGAGAGLTLTCADADCATLKASVPAELAAWTWRGAPLPSESGEVTIDTPSDEVAALEVSWESESGGGDAGVFVGGNAFAGRTTPGVTIVPLGAACAQVPVSHLGGCLHSGEILTSVVSIADDPAPIAVAQLNTLDDPATLVTLGVPWARWAVGGDAGSQDLDGDPWELGVAGAPPGPSWVSGDQLVYWLNLPEGATTLQLLHSPDVAADSLVSITCAGGRVSRVGAKKR